jgi:hypothetical protein
MLLAEKKVTNLIHVPWKDLQHTQDLLTFQQFDT